MPRHLGQHSGGIDISQVNLDTVVPLENARMPGRVVVKWDNEDCADLAIIKVGLLGLRMIAALEESTAIIRSLGGSFDLATIPPDDPKTYEMIERADTVGVFQIESGPRRRPCRGLSRPASMTWSSRWRSSVPARSPARWCTPTPTAVSPASPSGTRIRRWSRSSSARWACPCSKSSPCA